MPMLRSLVHGAAMGVAGDAEAAALMARGIENAVLADLVAAVSPTRNAER